MERVGNWHVQMDHIADCVNKFHSTVWVGNDRMIVVSYTHVRLNPVVSV